MSKKKYNFKNQKEIFQDLRHSVFVTFISYATKKINKNIIKKYPMVLIILRADGRIGFPGGKQEAIDIKNENEITIEDLKNTAIREVKEEIGYDIIHRDNLKLETNYIVNDNQIFNFSYYVTEKEMRNIHDSYKCEENINHLEVSGLNIVYITSNDILKTLLNNNFKMTARNELMVILKRHYDI